MWRLEFCPGLVGSPSCPSQFTLGPSVLPSCLLKLMAKSLIKCSLMGKKKVLQNLALNNPEVSK